MSHEQDPEDPKEYEIRNPRNLGTTTTTTTTRSMIAVNNPKYVSDDVIPEILQGYKDILKAYEEDNPNDKIQELITDYNSFANFLDLKPRDKEKEWHYYAVLFPENEDVQKRQTVEQKQMEQKIQRNLKYHVIPNDWLDSLNSFRSHVQVQYPPEVTPSRQTDSVVYEAVKQKLKDKVIKSRAEFMYEIGKIGVPVFYSELYDALYIYNRDNPNRIPMVGGKKTQTRRKMRKQSMRNGNGKRRGNSRARKVL